MAINLPPLPNGLQLLNTGLAPGDGQGDRLPTLAAKFNANMQVLLTQLDNLAGAGLEWDGPGRKLSLAALPASTLRVGAELVGLDADSLEVSQGVLRVKGLTSARLQGQIEPAKIQLLEGTLLAGSPAGGVPVAISGEFSLANSQLSLREIPYSKLVGINVAPSHLTLANRSIVMGNPEGRGQPVALSPDFVLQGGVLGLSSPRDQVGLNQLAASGTKEEGRLLGIAENADGTELELRWLTPVESIGEYVREYFKLDESKYELYVNGQTGEDALNNRGTSSLTPFKTLERALLEVARRSYVPGRGTDRSDPGTDEFDRVVIYVSPGNYEIDNRPGLSGANVPPYLASSTPERYHDFNAVGGGVIVPRGVSIVGSDLRKTKIYPRYIPEPDGEGGQTSIFCFTGASYFYGFTFVDNPTVLLSHHRVVCAQFASTADLSLYYDKIVSGFGGIDQYSMTGGANLQAVREESQIVADVGSATATDPTGARRADDVYGASPYIFNCSVRSRYGLCGVLADGARVTGLKSIVAAQFTIVSLQVDPNAYVGDELYATGRRYKPGWEHYGYRATQDAYMQVVSCFVIGAAHHFWVESGGELSITNSCGNFGGVGLLADGASTTVLPQDSGISILQIVPPQVIDFPVREIIVASLDTSRVTSTGVGVLQFLNIAPVELGLSGRVYIRIPSPISGQADLDLEAQISASGSPTNSNTILVTGTNQIHDYLTVTAPFDFESAWYNPTIDPDEIEDTDLQEQLEDLGIARTKAQQRTEEAALRVESLNAADVFVRRILDERTSEAQQYEVLLQVPPNRRVPVENYLVRHPNLPAGRGYFLTGIQRVSFDEIDESCRNLPGVVCRATLLRAERSDQEGLSSTQQLNPDALEDVGLSSAYLSVVANLDPALYPTLTSRLPVSYDPASISRIAIDRFLRDLGYTAEETSAMLTPRAGAALIDRGTFLIPRAGVYSNKQLVFDLLRPSTIRASAHTWEWVGYQNYSTALPRLQAGLLDEASALASLQSAYRGGRVYATGMNEVGTFFIGSQAINLRTGEERNVRFDSSRVDANRTTLPKTLRDLNITGRLTAQEINVSQLNPGGSIIFTPASRWKVRRGTDAPIDLSDRSVPGGIKATTSAPGLIRVATVEEARLGLPGVNAAMTPGLLRSFTSSYLSTVVKGITKIRLSLFPDVEVPTRSAVSSSIYVHPYEGGEISVYDPELEEWVLIRVALVGLQRSQAFTLQSIGATQPNRVYDLYVYNAGTYSSPLLGLRAVAWTGNLPPQRDYSLGVPTAVMAGEDGRAYRLVGVMQTLPDLVEGAVATGITLGGLYKPGSPPKAANGSPAGVVYVKGPAVDHPKVLLSNYYNQYEVTTRYFFGLADPYPGADPITNITLSGWYNDNLGWISPPNYSNTYCEFVQARTSKVTVFTDIYSNALDATSVCYVAPGMSEADAKASETDTPLATAEAGVFLPTDAFYGEMSGPNSTATSCWNRSLAEGSHRIWYMHQTGGTLRTNHVNEHPSHGMIVTFFC